MSKGSWLFLKMRIMQLFFKTNFDVYFVQNPNCLDPFKLADAWLNHWKEWLIGFGIYSSVSNELDWLYNSFKPSFRLLLN